MASVNKVILIGRLGADPEVRHTASDLAIATVGVATNSQSKDKVNGEWVETTEWHRVVFFDHLAEIVKKYLRKGSQIYVEGRLKTRKYTDKDGVDKWTTEIIANGMQMLGSKGDSGNGLAKTQPKDSPTKPPVVTPQPEVARNLSLDDDVPF